MKIPYNQIFSSGHCLLAHQDESDNALFDLFITDAQHRGRGLGRKVSEVGVVWQMTRVSNSRIACLRQLALHSTDDETGIMSDEKKK